MALGDYFTKDEALWLPKGSIRAVMALALIGGSIYLALVTRDLTTLIGLAGTAVGFYFGGKKDAAPDEANK